MRRATVGSYGGVVSYERGTPVVRGRPWLAAACIPRWERERERERERESARERERERERERTKERERVCSAQKNGEPE